ncbi:toxin-antitoxin system HicB family antitoxin [Phytoactinopolyspora alkaliphila]|uniref:Toxin-antitoxin system HicB family antitoxin n=1 Tax=Phytoactinopolyspora alkaliphila TaxID=1783498 RepID=A0A6N9YK61_9ACTN|nr:toxin-antitoxin system HicB family antitoxin [Phytoactinopolyspora alkaliphila]NED95393.1 toxin-antitoxin system HicB family antitoxin [Phytoactinopolyspora alkaliphila]
MELTPYVTSLRTALNAAADAAAADVREAADRLSYAVEPSLRLTLIEAFGDAAAEITTQLEGVSVDVRMRGGNPEFVASDERMDAHYAMPEPPAPPAPPPPPEPDEGTSRISLRLPESLKARVEEAAAAEGLSVNGWLIRAISQTLDGAHTGIQIGPQGVNVNLGRRITGWAR